VEAFGGTSEASIGMQSPPLKPWIIKIRERQWPELPVLLVAAAILGLSWGFVLLADQVVDGDTGGFDRWVIESLRNPNDRSLPRGPTWLVDAARDVTALGSATVLTLVVAIVVGYLAIVSRFRTIAILLAAVIGGAVLTTGLKHTYDRPRPPEGSAVQRTHSTSFPSGHSLASAVVYLTLGAMLARVMPTRKLHFYLIGVAIFLAILIGVTRVYLGVHYPTDVLAGWTAGTAWALLWWLIARWAIVEPRAEL
jgi:undecaprenyl-diphosphatase